MELRLQKPGDHLFIRSVSDSGICVVDDWYAGALILSAERLITDWSVAALDQISEAQLEPIFELAPEIVLLGTGAQQHFLPAELMMAFYRRGIGAEVMNTRAACRTFNVLASEDRQVVAALLPAGG